MILSFRRASGPPFRPVIRRVGAAAGVILGLLLLLASASTPATARTVGFAEITVPDGAEKPLVVGIWYPADAAAAPTALGLFVQTVAANAPPSGRGLPLIVMSHGTGGWYGEHYDTALALADAGFVVAAVSHRGDTFDDTSRAVDIIDRPRQLKRMTDYVLTDWVFHDRIDPARVGVFGFSAGGFTALVDAGGVADFSSLPDHIRQHPDYFDSQLVLKAGGLKAPALTMDPNEEAHDPRIRAAVVAAPALGFTFSAKGLAGVTLPVQLWRAEDDRILPHPLYAEAVRLALPKPPEVHVVSGAGHFDFLAPCTARLAVEAPSICRSAQGFDRSAFHAIFNREVVDFFRDKLR